jgi:hypothetical protein
MGRALILVESSRISSSIIVVVRCEVGFHRLATGGYGLKRCHPLPSGGAARGGASTVWRQVATGYGGYGLRWRWVES